MIFAANAILFAWIASFWSKTDAINIFVATMFAGFAVVNAALASPAIIKWIAP